MPSTHPFAQALQRLCKYIYLIFTVQLLNKKVSDNDD